MLRLPSTEVHRIMRIEHGERAVTKGIVIHTIEGTLAGAQSWFENPGAGGVGAHVGIGATRAVQWADLDQICWHAAGANSSRIGFEHEGYAGWGYKQWRARRRQRKMSANRAAWVCWRYGLGRPTYGTNIRDHADFPQGGHHDPGKGWPRKLYEAHARRAYRNLLRSRGKRWTRR